MQAISNVCCDKEMLHGTTGCFLPGRKLNTPHKPCVCCIAEAQSVDFSGGISKDSSCPCIYCMQLLGSPARQQLRHTAKIVHAMCVPQHNLHCWCTTGPSFVEEVSTRMYCTSKQEPIKQSTTTSQNFVAFKSWYRRRFIWLIQRISQVHLC